LPGDYTLSVVDALGNIETKAFVMGVANSIPTNEIVCGIYPNPAKNTLTIEFENHIPEYIKLYDILGQEIFSVKANSSCTVINISSFISGVYFVELLVDGKLITEKLIIE
jgi:type IV secretory pathway TrbL component